jgi:hypothetical protein
MNPERVRRALLDGYTISIDASTIPHPRLRRHAVFEDAQTFDATLAEAAALLTDGCAVLRWTLRTLDGCLRYRASVDLTSATPHVPLCRRIEEDCSAVLTSRATRDVSAMAVAKVMRYAALVLRGEAARSDAHEAIRHVERLLPRTRVSARVVGARL